MDNPFFNVVIKSSSENISECIESVNIERSISKDNRVVLTVKKDYSDRLSKLNLKNGKELLIRLGIQGGMQSINYLVRISNRRKTYGANISINIICTDLGLILKKTERFDDYSQKTTSSIVKEIADKNGLNFKIDTTTKVNSNLNQGGKTDYDFLKYLATIEGGDYRFYVDGDTIFFNKLNLSKKSNVKFIYPSDEWINFTVNEKDALKEKGSKNVKMLSYDPLNKREITSKTKENGSQKKLGNFIVKINARGDEEIVKQSVKVRKQDDSNKGSVIVAPSVNSEESLSKAESKQIKSSLSDITGSLTLTYTNRVSIDDIITIQGVYKEDAGNWYVDSISDRVGGGSGATTTLNLKRNATNEENNASKEKLRDADKNTSVGENKTSKKITVEKVTINANGEEV